MNEEQFDELARALTTNRLSRWQVLKSFAAGVLLAGPLGALWHSPASAQQSGTDTGVPCANDRVTAASLDAADSALAAGATQVKLSPKGCVRYRRILKGGRITSDEVTLEGKPALRWKHTSTKSTGQRDADLDGFFEWRSTVRRGAATGNKDRTVTKWYSPETKKLTRRETYTRNGKGWHVLIQEANQSGTLVKVAEFDTGAYVAAAASRDQGSGGNLTNTAARKVAPNAKLGINGLTTPGCSKQQKKHLQARLKDSRDRLIKCLQGYGADELVNEIKHYYGRPIEITCTHDVSPCPTPHPPHRLCPGDLAAVDTDSSTGQGVVTIQVNTDPTTPGYFWKGNRQPLQTSTLAHEMLHLNGGDFLHNNDECGETCQITPESRTHHDRTYACENLCFGDTTGQPPTKCTCDLCLSGSPSGRNWCNKRCKGLGTCPYPSYEKQCTFPTGGGRNPGPGPRPGPGPGPANKIYCSCNKKCYDDPQVCVSECKTSLGCFTNNCGPAQPGQCP